MKPATPFDVILRIGAAGGTFAILGQRQPNGSWLFRKERDESFHEDLLSTEERAGTDFHDRSGTVSTFAEALGLLADHPWHKLYPLQIHPDFRQAVFEAVEERTKAGGGRNDSIQDWKHECGIALD